MRRAGFFSSANLFLTLLIFSACAQQVVVFPKLLSGSFRSGADAGYGKVRLALLPENLGQRPDAPEPSVFQVRCILSGNLEARRSEKMGYESLRQLERRVHELINQQRRRARRRRLIWDERLAQAARAHSQNMAQRHFFDHRDPLLGNVDRRLDHRGIAWNICGENIYMQSGSRDLKESEEDREDLANDAVKGWMYSPGHRSNILNRHYTHTGIGAYYDESDQACYLTQIFIRPPGRRSLWEVLAFWETLF